MGRVRRVFLIALCLGSVAGCAAVNHQREGVAGPIVWRTDDIGVVTRQIDGKDADVYTFTLVIRENEGAAITFTTIETAVDDRVAIMGAPSIERGTWNLPRYGEWRISFPWSMSCLHVPGFCAPFQTVAPSWHIRMIGTNEHGRPIDIHISVELPPATIRLIFK